jgi:phosphoribosylformylglycinamidine cyclo-ligase
MEFVKTVTKEPIRYRDAGVDVEAGDRFAAGLAQIAADSHRPEVIGGIGGFAGLFALNTTNMTEPVLVSGTDGVGTKLLIAQQARRHDTIGIDLVAMCVNDILTVGAEPLFFLDYLATGVLDADAGNQVVAGIVDGCKQSGCALLGGETAEMPGMYAPGHYDLAGFAVGVVDRPNILDGRAIQPGDVVLGLDSSGLHSNGFSLVRHVLFERNQFALEDRPSLLNGTLVDELLQPTRIYAQAILPVLRSHTVHGMAHITGGGIAGNLKRILPDGVQAVLDRTSWTEPPIFQLLRSLGVPPEEMDLTFNLGLGLLLVCPANEAEAIRNLVASKLVPCNQVGVIEAGDTGVFVSGASSS